MDANTSNAAALITALPVNKQAGGLSGNNASRGLGGDPAGNAGNGSKQSDFSSTIKNLDADAVKETSAAKATDRPAKAGADASQKSDSTETGTTEQTTDSSPAETAAADDTREFADSTAADSDTVEPGNELPADGKELPGELSAEMAAETMSTDSSDALADTEIAPDSDALPATAEPAGQETVTDMAIDGDENLPLADAATGDQATTTGMATADPALATAESVDTSEAVVAAAAAAPSTARIDGSAANASSSSASAAAAIDADTPVLSNSSGTSTGSGQPGQGGAAQADAAKLMAMSADGAPRATANTLVDAGTTTSQALGTTTSAAAPGFSELLGDADPLPGQRPLQPMADPRSFAQGLNERLMLMSDGGVQTARIKLHPEALGPLEVRIQVDDDVARVSFTAQNGQTREALEQAMPRLKEMFAEQGLQLRSDVSSGQEQQNANSDRAGAATGEAGDGNRLAVDNDGRPMRDLDPARMRARRMLDVYA